MTKILVDSELLEAFVAAFSKQVRAFRSTVTGEVKHVLTGSECDSPEWEDVVIIPDVSNEEQDKLRAALDAPQQEAVAWQQSAAEVIASFVHLSANPNPDEWALVAVDAIRLLNILPAHPAPSVSEGWQLVPKKYDTNMLRAGFKALADALGDENVEPTDAEACFDAMLSAAPKAPTTDDRKDAEPWKERLRRIYDTLPDGAKKFYGKHGFAAYCAALDAEIDAAIAAQKGEKE